MTTQGSMQVRAGELHQVWVFTPAPMWDERGGFTRTFDTDTAASVGIDVTGFRQDSQSRSVAGVLRGMHGRSGQGEAKLVRCSAGAVFDVLVDVRPESPTFGAWQGLVLDDDKFECLYVPPGVLHGFQVLSDGADICYRIDRPHDPSEDLSMRYDDPRTAINWPRPVGQLSERDANAGSFADLGRTLGI